MTEITRRRDDPKVMAPEPYLSACLTVMFHAMIHARSLGWRNADPANEMSRESNEHIADLMDAVHNLPSLVQHWGGCNQDKLRNFLIAHDEKWQMKGPLLLKLYDDTVAAGG